MGRSAGGSRPRASLEPLLLASLDAVRSLVREWESGRRWSISVRRVVELTGVGGVAGRTAAGIALSKLEGMGYLVRLNGGRARKKYAPTPLGFTWARTCRSGSCGGCPLRRCPYRVLGTVSSF